MGFQLRCAPPPAARFERFIRADRSRPPRHVRRADIRHDDKLHASGDDPEHAAAAGKLSARALAQRYRPAVHDLGIFRFRDDPAGGLCHR